MALKRLLALLFAVTLVAGAVVFRNWRDTGGEISLTGDGLPIVCDEAIADACAAVFQNAQSRPPGTTFDDLVGDPDAEPFIWIAADVWFDMVDDERARGARVPEFGERTDGLAHSPLVFADPSPPECETLTWSCLAASGVDADLGIEDPERSSAGLLAWGQLAYERNGRSSGGLGWSDSEGIELEAGTRREILSYLNAAGRYDLVVVSNAAFTTQGPPDDVAPASDAEVSITIGAVVIGSGRLSNLDDLRDVLGDEGWLPGAGAEFDRPSPGGLIALRSR